MSAKTHLQHPSGATKPRTFNGHLYLTICGRWVCEDLVIGPDEGAELIECRQCLKKMETP